MRLSVSLAIVAVVAAAFQCLAGQVAAQQAGFRDLTTGWRVPSERLSIPQSCEKANSSIADSNSNSTAEKDLELTIVSTSPAKLEIGNDFEATVRLKNKGTDTVLVPSVMDGERVLRTSADGSEEKYEVGDVSFRLTSGKAGGIPVILNSGGALFADPEDKASYLPLTPGNWLELKLHARVECGLPDCVSEIQPDEKAQLTAWWYQRVLTHRVNGCDETHGSLQIRQVDSAPFPVEVRKPTSKTSSLAWNY